MVDNKPVVDRIVNRIRYEISDICGVVPAARRKIINLVGSYQLNLVEILCGNLMGSDVIFYDGENYLGAREDLEIGKGILTMSDLQWKRKGDMPHFDCSLFGYERDGKRMNFHGYVDSRFYRDRINLSFNSRRARVRDIYELDDQASVFVVGDYDGIVSAFNQTVADSAFKLLNKYIVSERGEYRVDV